MKQRSLSMSHAEPNIIAVVQRIRKACVDNYRNKMDNSILVDSRLISEKPLLEEKHSMFCNMTEIDFEKKFRSELPDVEITQFKVTLKDSMNSTFSEIKLKLSNFKKTRDYYVLQYEQAMSEFTDQCTSEDLLQAYHMGEANKMTKLFQENCQQYSFLTKGLYTQAFQKLLAGVFAKYKAELEKKLRQSTSLNKKLILDVVDLYQEEMAEHFKNHLHFSNSRLAETHNKACTVAISRGAGAHSDELKNELRGTLENYLKIYAQKNEMTSSQSDPAIGIDLGTVNCVVAVFRNGKVETIIDAGGNIKVTPSYVAFNENGNVDSVGDAAKQDAVEFPESTIYDSKRIIGRTMDEQVVIEDIKSWPFTVQNDRGKPKYKIFWKLVSPEEISAELLKECRNQAEKHLNCTVTKAVITVPAYFNDNQKRATRDAGKLAGLEILDIINEPTAAGIAYGWDQHCEKPKNVLIFDLGGGTFDVAVINVDKQNIKVLSFDGDTHLGGNDMDLKILYYCVAAFRDQYNIDLMARANSTTCSSEEKSVAKSNLERLRIASEKCKRYLQCSNKYTVIEPAIADGKNLRIVVTRDKFDEFCEDLYKRMLETITRVLNGAKIDKTTIDEIIMVGGNSRDPEIQKLVSRYFNQKALNVSINPSEAVAYGAAVKAAILNGDRFKNMLAKNIEDVVPMSIGIECILDGMKGKFFAIIERNSKYPTIEEDVFFTSRDDQDSGQIRVYQGDAEMCKDNYCIGSFIYEGIPPGEKGSQSLRVIMKLDAMGILDVEVICESTNKSDSHLIGEVPCVRNRRKSLKVTRKTGPLIE